MCDFLKNNFRRPQLIPTLFIIVATITLSFLGVWQLQRLQWKNNLVTQIDAAQNLPALGTLPENFGGLEYRKVALTGKFEYDKVLHLIGRQIGNFPGFFMLTPLVLEDDGRVILVNRGFAPVNKEAKPEGTQTIEGVIRPAREKRFFAPENIPTKNVWFYEDVLAMSDATEINLTPVIIEQIGKNEAGKFPILSDGKINLRNDHLGYAITWLATAVIGLIMFGFYHKKAK